MLTPWIFPDLLLQQAAILAASIPAAIPEAFSNAHPSTGVLSWILAAALVLRSLQQEKLIFSSSSLASSLSSTHSAAINPATHHSHL
jgi:hypothetical protein